MITQDDGRLLGIEMLHAFDFEGKPAKNLSHPADNRTPDITDFPAYFKRREHT
jgi:hypothetical protein